MSMKILTLTKKFFILLIIRKLKYYDNSNKLVIGQIKDETRVVAIKKFAGLKTKMHSFLGDNSEIKKAKCLIKNVETVGHN